MIVTALVAATVVSAGAAVYGAVEAGNAANTAAQNAQTQAANQQDQIDQLIASNNANLAAEQQQNQQIIAQMQTDSTNQINLLSAQNQQLQKSITDQGAQFQTATQSLIDAQNQAAKQASDAAKAAADAANNSGQLPHAANYGENLLANQRKNMGGITSTMLTGAGGVDSGALTLGKTTLLGAS